MRRFSIFSLGFLTALVAGEIWLQAVDPYHFAEREAWTEYADAIMDKQAGRLLPGTAASYMEAHTVIGDHGWRSPPFAVEKPDDVYRIVFLGDSVAFGWGVDEGEEFPRLVEHALKERGVVPGKRVEVINTGVPGWRLIPRLKLLNDTVVRWQPDMVIVMLVSIDVARPAKAPPISFLDDDLRRVRLLRALENRVAFGAPGSRGEDYDSYADLPRRGLEVTGLLLDIFDRLCRKCGARPVVFDTLGSDFVRQHLTKLGMHRIEGYLTWAERRSHGIAMTDPHPDAGGHRRLAEMVLQGLPASLFR